MADLEKGMYGGNDTRLNTENTPIQAEYVTAMLKGRAGNLVLKGVMPGAESGLRTLYDGCRPQHRPGNGARDATSRCENRAQVSWARG